MSSSLYSGVSGLALGTGLYKNVSGLWGGASGLIDGFGGGDPFSGASLYLNFLAGAPLDSRITFTRGSNATLVDSTGKIVYAPANLLLQSQTIATAPWSGDTSGGSVPTATNNAGIAPDGTNTATRLQINRGAGTFSRWNQSVVSAAATYVYSIYMKTFSGGTSNVGLRLDTTGINCVVTETWQRFSITLAVSGGTTLCQILSFTSIPGTDVSADILVWGAQIEPVTYQTTPSTYVATVASAYYGPRFDYDPVTLAPKGLLIEEQRTNVVTYSEQLDNVAWTKAAVTVTANATTSPDGTVNADAIYQTAVTSLQAVNSAAFVATSGVTYTLSVYLKAGTSRFVQVTFPSTAMGATQYANIDLTVVTVTASAASTVSVASVGNGWVRVNYTVAATAPSNLSPFIIAINSGSDARGATITGNVANFFYAYGAQVEAGAFATSYIPTVASQVTRSADVATMTGTNFSSWYNQTAGTFIVAADSYTVSTTDFVLTASDGTANNRFGLYRSSSNIGGYVVTGGVTQMDLTRTPVSANTPYLAAVAATLNDGNTALNGSVAAGDTSITMGTLDRLSIGANNGAGFISGHIRQIAYYNTRLTNAQLQTLTAPSLVTTLSMSFTNQAYTVGV